MSEPNAPDQPAPDDTLSPGESPAPAGARPDAMADTLAPSTDAPLDAANAETMLPASTGGSRRPTPDPLARLAHTPAPQTSATANARYALGRMLGEGGIGLVRSALDRHLGREVAMKTLRPGGLGTLVDDATEKRFLTEARITGQLEHPNIVSVHELGRRPDGTPYYTMAVVRGATMADALEGKDLTGRLALLPAFVDACQAIAYAHSKGVIHRDLKPGNIMLGAFGETQVLDWGLARRIDGADPLSIVPGTRLPTRNPYATLEGQAIGTPAYMPPEQALGELSRIDERSDVYSLGAILYELLTGQPPFTGEHPLAIAMKVVREPLTPVARREHRCPPELAAIAERALSKAPEARYADARALAADVVAFREGELVGAYRYTRGERLARFAKKHAAVLAAGLVVLAVAIGVWVVQARLTAEAAARAESARVAQVLERVDTVLAKAQDGGEDTDWLDAYTFELVALKEAAVEARLAQALANPDPSVRVLTARALGGMHSTHAVDALIARLRQGVEPEEAIQVAVVNALGLIGDARAEAPVAAVREAAGQHGYVWKNTATAYSMIPLPPPHGLDAEGWLKRGRALQRKRRWGEAAAAYAEVLARNPGDKRALNNRALLRRAQGDQRGALAEYDKLIKLHPDDTRAYYNRALVRRKLGDLDGARRDLDRAVADPRTAAIALRARASLALSRGRLGAAREDVLAAKALKPRNARVRRLEGRIALLDNRPEDALASLAQALQLAPKDRWAHMLRARVHMATGDLEAAKRDADRTLAINPDEAYALALRAVIELKAGNVQGARVFLDRSVEQARPTDARRRKSDRAVLLLAGTGDLAGAAAALAEVLPGAPSAERGRLRLLAAEVQRRRGQLAAADLVDATADAHGQQLLAVARGDAPSAALVQALKGDLDRQCEGWLAASLAAERAGDELGAAQWRAKAAAQPDPVDPACALLLWPGKTK